MEFKQSVQEELLWYVYALVDPRNERIFYIGKGRGNRVFQHAEDAIKKGNKSLKLDTIREIIAAGLKVEHYIIRYKISTEEEAYLVESVLIDVLTYPKFNTEKVLTNLVSGHHQWDEGIKSAEEITILYDCPKIEVVQGHKLLLVSLNKSYDQGKAADGYKRPDIYECTRKYWKVSFERASKTNFVLGVYKGVVRAVYQPCEWIPYDCSEDGKTIFNTTRYGFRGIPILDSPYLNKDVSDYPFGSGGAITYIPRNIKEWF